MKKSGQISVKQPSKTKKNVQKTTTDPGELRKGTLLELLIDHLDEDGTGVASHLGRNISVTGTLPQDRCLARVSHIGKTFVSASIVRFLALSPLRTDHNSCEDSEQCLGCPLIQMQYPEQLAWKRNLVKVELDAYPSSANIELLQPVSPQRLLHYRTTAKLAVAGSYSEPYIGIYRRSSHDVVHLEGCPLHHPLINKVITAVRKGIVKLKVPVWQEKNKTGILRYLVVRVSESSNEVMVTFVTFRRAFNEIHHLAKFLQQHVPNVKVVCQNVNSSDGNVIFGSQDHFLSKQQTIGEAIGKVQLLVSHRSFLQAQNDGARLLYESVRDWAALNGKQAVLDLYCGIGGIALTIASDAGKVLAVEINPDAVADARKNARLNKIKNCRFEAADVREFLEDLLDDGEHFDVVTLNPPRRGCDREVLNCLVGIKPAKIIYVSCSPKTLARDIDILSSKGYRCLKIQPVDMFPQTAHIENVALLELS